MEAIRSHREGAGGEISNAVTIEEIAMVNPVILSTIFSQLDVSTLAGLRLVCKTWDEVAISSPEFSKRGYLHLHKVFPCCSVAPVLIINPKLTKNICIDISDGFMDKNFKCENQCKDEDKHAKQAKDAAAKNLITFFKEYHHLVHYIKCFNGKGCDSFYTHLVNCLNTLDFKKLQGISFKDVLENYYRRWDWEGQYDEVIPTFATRRNLKSLQLVDTITDSPFQDIFQKLINFAPNLEEITIRGNFYPDLATCKNLKVLNYSGIPYYYWDCPSEKPSFNLKSLSKMLDQVKHSLIKLSLEDSYLESKRHDEYDHSQQEFNFPDVAKNLEFLCIQENSGRSFFQPELMKLNPSQFPKLKNLVIGVQKGHSFQMYNPGIETLDNVLGGISHSFGTISSLHLSGTLSSDIGHRIRFLFPNLIRLTMPWRLDESGEWDEEPDVDRVIHLCSGWKLQELDIATTMQFDWGSFMQGLIDRLKRAQNDLRMLKLRSRPVNYFSFENPVCHFWYDTKKQQQQVGTTDLEILTFGPESEKVSKFISGHPLTVHFI